MSERQNGHLRETTTKDYRRTWYISDFKNNGGKDNSDNDGNWDEEETQSDAADLNDDIHKASSGVAVLGTWEVILRWSPAL